MAVSELAVKVTGDISDIKSNIKSLQKDLKDLERPIKFDGDTNSLASKLSSLKRKGLDIFSKDNIMRVTIDDQASNRIKTLKRGAVELASKTVTMPVAIEGENKLKSAINRIKSSLSDMSVNIKTSISGLDTSGISGIVSKIKSSLSGIGSTISSGLSSAFSAGVAGAKSLGFAILDIAGNAVMTLVNNLKLVTLAVGAAAVAFAGLTIKRGLDVAKDLQRTKLSFDALIPSIKDSTEVYQKLYKFTSNTPFEFAEVGRASKTLLGFGVVAKDIEPLIKKIGNVSALTGTDMDQLAVVFGQIKSKGKLTGEEMRQLVNAGFSMREELSKVSGVALPDLDKAISDGVISFDKFDKAFTMVTTGTGRYAKGIEALENSLIGLESTQKDTFDQIAASVVGFNVETAEIKKGGIADKYQQFLKLFKDPGVVNSLNTLGDSVGMFVTRLMELATINIGKLFNIDLTGDNTEKIQKIIDKINEFFKVGPDGKSPAEVQLDKLGALAKEAYVKFEEFRVKAIQAFNMVKAEATALARVIKEAINSQEFKDFKTNIEALTPVFKALYEAMKFIGEIKMNEASNSLSGLSGTVVALSSVVTNLRESFDALFKGDYKSFFSNLAQAIVSFAELLLNALQISLAPISGILEKLGIDVSGGFDKAKKSLSEFKKSLELPPLKINVTNAITSVDSVIAKLKTITDTTPQAEVLIEASKAKAEVNYLATKLGEIDLKSVSPEVATNTNLAISSLNDVSEKLATIDATTSTADVTAITAQAVTDMQIVKTQLNSINGSVTTANVTANTYPATTAIASVNSELNKVDATVATADVTANTSQANFAIASVSSELTAVDARTATVDINGNNSDATSKINTTSANMSSLNGRNATVTITANNQATSVIDSIKARLNSLPKFISIPIKTIAQKIGLGFSEGGIVPNKTPKVGYYAKGKMLSGPKGTDTIPAYLSPGEAVLPANTVRQLGVGFTQGLIKDPMKALSSYINRQSVVGRLATNRAGDVNNKSVTQNIIVNGLNGSNNEISSMFSRSGNNIIKTSLAMI